MSSTRLYVASFENVTPGAGAQDIFSIRSPAGKGIDLVHLHVEAGAISAPAEYRVRLKRTASVTAAGTGGTAATAYPVDMGTTQASAAIVRTNDITTQMTGTFQILLPFYWNVLNPFDYFPLPEERFSLDVSQGFALDMPAFVASVPISGYAVWIEDP